MFKHVHNSTPAQRFFSEPPFTSERALVPFAGMDRSSLYEYTMCNHSKAKVFVSTFALLSASLLRKEFRFAYNLEFC